MNEGKDKIELIEILQLSLR